MAGYQVETYEVTESDVTGLTPDAELAECEELVHNMGLTAQLKFVTKDDESVGSIVHNPYRNLTAIERRICLILFPACTEIEKYGSSPIPLRVLQVAAHAHGLGMKCWVFHPADPNTDPVLVGTMGKASDHGPKYSSDTASAYLLARWGAALESWDVLAEKAKTVYAATRRAKLRKEIAEQSAELMALETSTDSIDLAAPDYRFM